MLSKIEKEDVLHNVSVELVAMFGVLTNHYNRPEFIAGLSELEKIEIYLKAKLIEYDPLYVTLFPDLSGAGTA
jgi:hypothetical protein